MFGNNYTFLSTQNGLCTFGDNFYGQFGHGNRRCYSFKKLNIVDIVTMACGHSHPLV